jgi:hypothetical protein
MRQSRAALAFAAYDSHTPGHKHDDHLTMNDSRAGVLAGTIRPPFEDRAIGDLARNLEPVCISIVDTLCGLFPSRW